MQVIKPLTRVNRIQVAVFTPKTSEYYLVDELMLYNEEYSVRVKGYSYVGPMINISPATRAPTASRTTLYLVTYYDGYIELTDVNPE